ncbi:putative mediator of RNA polymerase II transcription subunit 11 [[Candida] railenensis]|uniref:Mediator of RNA polymerase II transcription subunit 11 n=1 Tax=[Candida] railenensis TaxID=45579 RepID=A0A9P0QRU7_9ASCO|nr:putative mediator of RNA polymerase II transcription subunit 11 [[Candida] railenensis]
MPDTFIQERLNSLHEIDCKIVSLLDSMSTIFQTYTTPKSSDALSQNELREQFELQTKSIYNLVSTVAIDLRKEVKVMDDNIGVYDKNEDGVMILPISVDQKNSTLGDKKMKYELSQMDKIIHIERKPVEVVEREVEEKPTELKKEEASSEPTFKEVKEEEDSDSTKDSTIVPDVVPEEAPATSHAIDSENQTKLNSDDDMNITSINTPIPEPEVKQEPVDETTTKTDEGQDTEMKEVPAEGALKEEEDPTKTIPGTETFEDDMLFGDDDADTDMFF